MMSMRNFKTLFLFSTLLLIAGLFLQGCSDDDPVSPDPGFGTVVVSSDPPSLNAAWTLTGPGGTSRDGNGEQTLNDLPAGDYTVSWGVVANWISPLNSTQTLDADATLTFGGNYTISTADHMMQNFLAVYEGMFPQGYEALLHSAHHTVVLQSTFDEWAGSDNALAELYFDKDLATTIHANIFSSQIGTGPGGEPIPPVDSIVIPLLNKDEDWELVPEEWEYFGDFENAYYARYEVLMYFNNPDQHRYQIDQMMHFIAIDVSGGELNDWRLLGIIPYEVGLGLATDSISYDEVLAMYR